MVGNIVPVNRRRCLGGGAALPGGLLAAACGEAQPAESAEEGPMGGIFSFIRQIFGSRGTGGVERGGSWRKGENSQPMNGWQRRGFVLSMT